MTLADSKWEVTWTKLGRTSGCAYFCLVSRSAEALYEAMAGKKEHVEKTLGWS